MKQRELKFRVWRNADKRFIQISGYKLQGGKLYPWEWRFDQTPAYHYIYTLEDVVIMQFTGLVDKNGKEIYEGDVLKVEDPYGENTKVFAVQFKDGAYQIEWSSMFNGGDSDITAIGYAMQQDFTFEIIGNLYETPDLLTPQPNP